MIAPLSNINPITLADPSRLSNAGAGAGASSFQGALQSAMNAVESARTDAAGAVERVLRGETQELHTAVLATQRAEMAFELGLQMRNKLVQAYQEIMRMPM